MGYVPGREETFVPLVYTVLLKTTEPQVVGLVRICTTVDKKEMG